MLLRIRSALSISGAILLTHVPSALASGRYSQVVLQFPNQRDYHYSYSKAQNALSLEFARTSAEELTALNQYDERLIRRVIMKDLGPNGTQVTMVLKDRGVRASIASFKEPFRVVIDLFDQNFKEDRDPVTGMPLVNQNANSGANPELAQDDADFVSRETPKVKDTSEKTGYQLLQPNPGAIYESSELISTLESAPDGLGKSWREFPEYVYRLQTAPYESEKSRGEWLRANAPQAATSAQAMADYASKLFDFGHEYRAMIAYQQVLHRDPRVFDQDSLHLWKFGEIHLGQSNLTLAQGYYQTLIEKHPDSSLARFAQLRLLDVQSIRAINRGDGAALTSLIKHVDKIATQDNPELLAQATLRRIYWSQNSMSDVTKIAERGFIPTLSESNRAALSTVLIKVESQKTYFLASTILLGDMVKPESAWQPSYGVFAGQYFDRFRGDSSEPYRSILRDRLKLRLDTEIQDKVSKGQFLAAINSYEALPSAVQAIRKSGRTGWALGEAYRSVGQIATSVSFYQSAAQNLPEGSLQFRSNFWLAISAGQSALDIKKSNPAKSAELADLSKKADASMWANWNGLKETEQQAEMVAYKPYFESSVNKPPLLKGPALILLNAWTKGLNSEVATTAVDAKELKSAYSPSAAAVAMVTAIGERFKELGMETERRQALQLLRNLKPADFKGDGQAQKDWARQLISLADEYRSANEFLEAGQLYVYTGAQSANWEHRAETLYKGGLLLYRAGRRQEAIDAFTKASQDGGNQFYADLAKERLERLNQ